MKRNLFIFSLLVISALMASTACRKDDLVSNDKNLKLTFSADSVIFDTVFSSLGTVTRKLMVYNTSNKRINISNIQLTLGQQSVFRMNVDGIAGLNIQDVDLAPNDSLYVLVKATIDPRDQNNPYVVEDDLVFMTNGNEQRVKLVAWGQDAHYIIADQKVGNFPKFKIVADSLETVYWTADKPYVVYGYALINSYGTLVIEEGTRIHFHDGSGLWAYVDGVLKVRGTLENPVTFQGDRLDADYRDVPGQWDRIWLMEGRAGFNHEIDHAIIRNAFIGVQAESFLRPTSNQLTLSNTVIENNTGMGIFSRLFAIDASNVVVANCGSYAVALTSGGAYRFIHSTLINNWSYGIRNTAALFFNNFILDSLDNPIPVPINLSFGNSIIYGSNDDEIERELVAGADTTYLFDHCFIKLKDPWKNQPVFSSSFINEDPLLEKYPLFDYEPDSLSPVIGKGKPEIANDYPLDLRGVSRIPSADVGALQFTPVTDEK